MQPHGVELLSVENLLYYPRTLVLHYFPSLALFTLGALSIVWAIMQWRDRRRRGLLLYFTIGLLMMVVKTQNEIRFLATFVPAPCWTRASRCWPRQRALPGKRETGSSCSC